VKLLFDMQPVNSNSIEDTRKKWTALLFTSLLTQVVQPSVTNKKEIYDMTKRVEKEVYLFAIKNAHNGCIHVNGKMICGETNPQSDPNLGERSSPIVKFNSQCKSKPNLRPNSGSKFKEKIIVDKNESIDSCNTRIQAIYVKAMQEKIKIVSQKNTSQRNVCECVDGPDQVTTKRIKMDYTEKPTLLNEQASVFKDKVPVFTIVSKKTQTSTTLNLSVGSTTTSETKSNCKVDLNRFNVNTVQQSNVRPLTTPTNTTPTNTTPTNTTPTNTTPTNTTPTNTTSANTTTNTTSTTTANIIPNTTTNTSETIETPETSNRWYEGFLGHPCTREHVMTPNGGLRCDCDCDYYYCKQCPAYDMWKAIASVPWYTTKMEDEFISLSNSQIKEQSDIPYHQTILDFDNLDFDI
jgi:hypothetical protein